jgi:endonuclease/exonuclease/phosphatase family metal-dependent hydrolase
VAAADLHPPTTRVVVAGAVVGAVLLRALQDWGPALLFGTGSLRAVPWLLAVAGSAPFLATLAPIVARGRMAPARLWRLALLVTALARVAAALTSGPARAVALGVTIAACGTALVALAQRHDRSGPARTGVLIGVVLVVLVHTATGTLGLGGLATPWPAVAGAVEVAVLVLAALAGPGSLRTTGAVTSRATSWLLVAPLLVLVVTLTGAAGRTAVVTGWPAWQVAATVAVVHVVAIVGAVLAPALGPTRSGWIGAAAVLVGTASALEPRGWPTLVGMATTLAGLGLLLGTDPAASAPSARLRHAAAASGALVLTAAVITVYHLANAVTLPVNNRWLLLALAAAASLYGASIAAAAGRASLRTGTLPQVRPLGAAVIAVALVALTSTAAALPSTAPPPARETATGELRIAVFDITSGHDALGRLAISEQAAVLRREAPDVVVLTDLDRGWLLSGHHDVVALHARELGLPHVAFSPAADELRGSALLSRFPIAEFGTERLPRGSDPMERSHFAAVLEVDGDLAAIVGTELGAGSDASATRLPQARAVAATAARLRQRQLPVVLAGSFGVPAGAPELAAMSPVLADLVPDAALTTPSDEPTTRTEHVLATDDVSRLGVSVPPTASSEHRPVVLTLRIDR